MSKHYKNDNGDNLCGTTAPDHGDNLCVLCEGYAGIDRSHPCRVVDYKNGFIAQCECGYQSRVKPTPSHAYAEVRAHWRQTLGEVAQPKPKSKPKSKVCHCGCTELTAGGVFRAGHDARWLAKLRLAIKLGEIEEAEAKRQVGAISERLLLKFQHALDGRVVS